MNKNKILLFNLILFIPTVSMSACPKNTVLDETTGVCVKSGCNGDCHVYYAPNSDGTYDVTVTPVKEATGEIVLAQCDPGCDVDYVHNVTIGEGITGLGGLSIWSIGSGTLKLPSTLTSMESKFSTYSIGFETIDLSDVTNFQTSPGAYGNSAKNAIALSGAYNLKNLIVSEDTSPIALGYDAYHNPVGYPESGLVIQCKGTDLAKCENKFTYATGEWYYKPADFETVSEYYVQKDENGHILEAWGPNGVEKYAYDKGGNLLRKTDANGKTLWARRIYSVDEAEKASGTKNTFRIRYK